MKAYSAGIWAERLAALYLRVAGYRILAMRLKTYGGEADIVAKKGNVIVVCEVKFRRRHNDAAYSIAPRQLARLERAAEIILARFGDMRTHIRFDAMLFSLDALPRYIKNIR